MIDKTSKRRHKIDYWSAIVYHGLVDEYFIYLKEKYGVKHKHGFVVKVFSPRRHQRAFCLKKGLKLLNTVFDLTYVESGYGL